MQAHSGAGARALEWAPHCDGKAMKIKVGNDTFDIDDDALLTWLMREMSYIRDTANLATNVTEVHPRNVQRMKPRAVRITINSPVDLLKVGPLIKLEPMTHFTFVFPRLGSDTTSTLELRISSPMKIELWVQGKNVPGFKSGTYDSLGAQMQLLYTKCWHQPNVPILYGQTCADLLRLLKAKDLQFIQTSGDNWPLFCGVVAKLLTCVGAAESARCVLMLPIMVMDLQLGKHQRRGLSPISDYQGSSTDLIAIEEHYEARANNSTAVPPLTPRAQQLRAEMLKVIADWLALVYQTSKKKDDYIGAAALQSAQVLGGLSLAKGPIAVKVLAKMDDILYVNPHSMNEQVIDEKKLAKEEV